jgi:hypothetical protein
MAKVGKTPQHTQALCSVPGLPTAALVHFPREPRGAGYVRTRSGIKLQRARRGLERGADALASADDVVVGRLAFEATIPTLESWLGVAVGGVCAAISQHRHMMHACRQHLHAGADGGG